jgi:hypothetical protein
MSADLLDLLCAADPATNMAEATADDRERLRSAIIATPLNSQPRLAQRFAHPRLLIAATVGGGIILLGGSALAATIWLAAPPLEPRDSVGVRWQQVPAVYEAWTHKLELPPGLNWPGIAVPSDGGGTSAEAGAYIAIDQAIGLWAKECIAAGAAADGSRVEAAISHLAELRTLMRSDQGLSENQSGYDQSLLDELNGAIAAAKKGQFEGLRFFESWAQTSAHYTTPYPMPSPAYPVGWEETANHPQTNANDLISAEQMRAEYQTLLATVGLPPGVSLGDPTLGSEATHSLGEGFVDAFNDAWTVWWREWVAAVKAGDQGRIAAAAAASAHLQKLLPLKAELPGLTVSITLDAKALDAFRQLAAQARQGDMSGIKAWLAYQEADRARIRAAGTN